jgi:hypothetical protein
MKKTPRELLLARYTDGSSQLDVLRNAALVEATPVPANQLLHAIFFPQRRLWLGLAVAWLVILTINFTQRPPTPRSDTSATLYAAHWSAYQAQLHAVLTKTSPYR